MYSAFHIIQQNDKRTWNLELIFDFDYMYIKVILSNIL